MLYVLHEGLRLFLKVKTKYGILISYLDQQYWGQINGNESSKIRFSNKIFAEKKISEDMNK